MPHPSARGRALALAAVLLLAGAAAAGAAETQGIEAFATWTLQGSAVPSAPEQVTLVASLQGPLFVDAGAGPIHAGTVSCPGTLTINLADGSQTGEGVCAFLAKDGAEAYGRWSCGGYLLLGCRGTFTFTGGAGRLEGIAGGSRLLIRGDLPVAGAGIAAQPVGIIQWQELAASLPAQD